MVEKHILKQKSLLKSNLNLLKLAFTRTHIKLLSTLHNQETCVMCAIYFQKHNITLN